MAYPWHHFKAQKASEFGEQEATGCIALEQPGVPLARRQSVASVLCAVKVPQDVHHGTHNAPAVPNERPAACAGIGRPGQPDAEARLGPTCPKDVPVRDAAQVPQEVSLRVGEGVRGARLQKPARGISEVKGTNDDAWIVANGEQVSRYWGKYRQFWLQT